MPVEEAAGEEEDEWGQGGVRRGRKVWRERARSRRMPEEGASRRGNEGGVIRCGGSSSTRINFKVRK